MAWSESFFPYRRSKRQFVMFLKKHLEPNVSEKASVSGSSTAKVTHQPHGPAGPTVLPTSQKSTSSLSPSGVKWQQWPSPSAKHHFKNNIPLNWIELDFFFPSPPPIPLQGVGKVNSTYRFHLLLPIWRSIQNQLETVIGGEKSN